MSKVSIIVPCYNMSKYISRCLDSLTQQTLSDLEIICIDDKSTDNTLEILQEYASRDTRIRVVPLPKNYGVSEARNHGTEIATAPYIGFVDPDDYVDTDYYEKLYNRATETDADITVGNICETRTDGSAHRFTKWLKSLEQNKLNFNYTLWCAIYKTSFIRDNHIDCPTGIITSQDTVFTIKAAVLANKIATVPDTYYNYVRVCASLSSRYLSDEKIQSKIDAANLITEFLNSVSLSPDDYVTALFPMFHFIYLYASQRTTRPETQLHLAKAAIQLYQKSTHREHLLHAIEPRFRGFFICNDTFGLCEYVREYFATIETVKYVKLFNILPIIRIKNYDTYTKYSVFGIPVLRIYTHPAPVSF